MPYNVYRDESFDEPAWVKRVLPKNLTIGVLGFSFRYDPKEPLALLEIPGFLTAVKDQDRSPIAPPQRFERKTLSAPELEIHRAQESTRLIARTTGLDETYHLYLLHLDADWSGYDAGRYFTCLLKPDLDSGVPCSFSEFLPVRMFVIPYLDGHGRQRNLGDLLHLLRVREVYWTRP